jgi:CRISPR-associated protein Csx10
LVGGAVPEPPQETLTRVALNRRVGRAQDQQLYSLQVLSPMTVFVGRVRGLAPSSAAMLVGLAASPIEIGTARSRGLGRCQMVVLKPNAGDDPWGDTQRTVSTRFNDMQKAWGDVVEGLGRLSGSKSGIEPVWVFSISLIGDAILGGNGLPTRLALNPSDLALSVAGIRTLSAASNFGWRRGFHDVRHQRKPQELVTLAGSAFLFCVPRDNVSHNDLVADLERVEALGIGRRRTEGFGEIAVCHLFHSRYATAVL